MTKYANRLLLSSRIVDYLLINKWYINYNTKYDLIQGNVLITLKCKYSSLTSSALYSVEAILFSLISPAPLTLMLRRHFCSLLLETNYPYLTSLSTQNDY